MSLANVFMFSGQGSHYCQMGRTLFDSDAIFRASMLRMNDLVQKLSGESVIDALYLAANSKSAAFDRSGASRFAFSDQPLNHGEQFVVVTMAFDPFPPPQKVDPAFGRDSLDDRFQVAFAVRES